MLLVVAVCVWFLLFFEAQSYIAQAGIELAKDDPPDLPTFSQVLRFQV